MAPPESRDLVHLGARSPLVPLTTEAFRDKALAIPDIVSRALAGAATGEEVRHLLDGVDLLAQYARKIKADTKVVNAIQYGRLKVIARYGELDARMTPQERGAKGGKEGGRGNKKSGAEKD
jgi:hypothetical protein